MSTERNNSQNDLVETHLAHCTTSFPAGVKDDVSIGLFLGAIFGSGFGALFGVLWVVTQLLGEEGTSLPLGGGLLGVLAAITLSIVGGAAVVSLVFIFLGLLGIYRTDPLRGAQHTFTVRSPKSRSIMINASVDVVWENIIQPQQACWLFNGCLTETQTRLPWEGFWLSYPIESWGAEELSGENYQVPVRIIANEAARQIEFHRYPEERLYDVAGPSAFLSAHYWVGPGEVGSPVHRILHDDDSPVDRIVAVELTPGINGCQMRIQAFNIYRLLPSSIVSWPFYILWSIVKTPFRFLIFLATRLGPFEDNIQKIKSQIESKVSVLSRKSRLWLTL